MAFWPAIRTRFTPRISKLSELEVPDDSGLPAVDALVNARMRELFVSCTEPSVVRKGKPISVQCLRLLAVLLRDVGTPVPLPELLLANGLRSATPRRLRELETEHGAFEMRTFSRDRLQHYVLVRPEPDLDRCGRYWIRANIRDSRLPAGRRVLAFFPQRWGTRSRRDLDYVLPEEHSTGQGLSATPVAYRASDRRVRNRGYRIDEVPAGSSCPTSARDT